MNDDTRAAFLEMRDRDPDNSPTEPTLVDYDRFERWAIATYGRELYIRYRVDSWDVNDSLYE